MSLECYVQKRREELLLEGELWNSPQQLIDTAMAIDGTGKAGEVLKVLIAAYFEQSFCDTLPMAQRVHLRRNGSTSLGEEFPPYEMRRWRENVLPEEFDRIQQIFADHHYVHLFAVVKQIHFD